MKNIKEKFFILMLIVIVVICTGCAQKNEKIGYKKITPEEAQIMMDGDVIILDARTEKEFSNGHIRYAVLIPDYELKKKIEEIVPNKSKIILIYAKKEDESRIAAEELIKLGYTNIYDFGAIDDWIGEIVGDSSATVFYNYFGGELPPDVIEEIDYNISKRINDEMQEFNFNIKGIKTRTYYLTYNKQHYYDSSESEISSITITSNDSEFKQEITFEKTLTPDYIKTYGFNLDDWNFDGYLDISLFEHRGGSMGNSPHYYWIWDKKERQFIENSDLEIISHSSRVSIDKENEQIISWSRAGLEDYTLYYKVQKSNKYLLVKADESKLYGPDDPQVGSVHHIIRELVNGKMVITEEYDEDLGQE